jgi:hypothetical protein
MKSAAKSLEIKRHKLVVFEELTKFTIKCRAKLKGRKKLPSIQLCLAF